MKNRIALSLTLLLCASPLTWAAEGGVVATSRALSLQDCIAIALNESPLLEASRLDVASATEAARAARGQALPQITGIASAQLFSGSPTSKFSIVNVGDSSGIGVNSSRAVDLGAVEVYSAHLSYPLFRDGSILGLNTAPQEASQLARRRNLAWTSRLRREDVIARITDAFITTVSAENRAGYAERRVKLLGQQVDVTQEQEKQGLTLPIDLKLSKDQLSGANTLAKILRQQAVAGKIELSRALGFNSPDELHLSNELPEPPEPPSAELLLGPSLSQHPSLEVQKAVIDQAQQEYRLERFRLYPSVTLQGSAVHIDDFSPGGAEVYTGAVSVNVPIFDFGAQQATTRSRLAKYQAERARLAAVTDDITFEIVTIYQSIYVLSQNILSLQEEVAKADRDLQVTGSQQEQGIATPLMAIDRELRLIAKRDALDGLQVRRLMLYAALQKASGGSWKWFQ
ncbi:MAG: TolC family protein [Chthoniobacterales bacterium]|nr:TolC family protein [Chthoniobacterales bacterium]